MRLLNGRLNVLQVSAAIIVVGIALVGCGGGGGGGGSTPPPPPSPAPTVLNTIIQNPTPANLANLPALTNQLGTQVTQHPGDPTANAGFAICSAASAGQALATANGITLTFGARVRSHASQSSLLSQLGSRLEIWNLPSSIVSSGSVKVTPLDLVPSMALPATIGGKTVTGLQEQTDLRALDAVLVKAEASLNVVLSVPGFVYVIADPTQPTNPNARINLGSAEFEVLRAFVAAVRAVVNASVAYSADTGSFNFNAPVSTVFATQYTTFGPVPVSEYLPPSPFATLEPDGTTRVANIKSELSVGFTAAIAAITDVQSRNNAGFLLNPGTVVSPTQLNTFKTDAQMGAADLNNPAWVVQTNNGPITIDLPHFFSNPPADLKALAAPINVADGGFGNVVLSFGTSPDPTYGGLFPGGNNNVLPTSSYFSFQGDQTPEWVVITNL